MISQIYENMQLGVLNQNLKKGFDHFYSKI